MFTGIITAEGRILSASPPSSGERHLVIQCPWAEDTIALGASIACSGVCLTVTEKGEAQGGSWFGVYASAETLAHTAIGQWCDGAAINLERAVCAGDELGGHVTTGHVDACAELLSITEKGESWELRLHSPEPLHRFIAAKGSVALDGISLTVNHVQQTEFTVNIIPHTWQHTTLHYRKAGDSLHLEVDMMARYAARWSDTQPSKRNAS